MNLRFPCPSCDYPGRLTLPGVAEWLCPRCDHVARPIVPAPEPTLPACALCGNRELYKKKDFPHNLGMAILLGACVASSIACWFYEPWITWAILLGSAAIDGGLYLLVPDVVVCYRCGCHHRGAAANELHRPFELTVHERFRQERLRREEIARSTTP